MRCALAVRLSIVAWLVMLSPLLAASTDGQLDWPQWLGISRDGIWKESGIVQKLPAGGPKVAWRVPVGIGYSGPAVAGDRVFVTDRERTTDAEGKPRRPTRNGVLGNERVLCLDARDGKQLWEHVYDCPYTISYPNGPRTTPLVEGEWVYSLGAMGDLNCLASADGKPRWEKNLAKTYGVEPPVWGFAAHPLIDGDLLYCLVGGKGAAVVALNKSTGAEVWKTLDSEEVGYSPPMIYDLAGRRQLVVWLSEAIYGLDPASGKELWRQAYPIDIPVMRPAVNIVTVKKTGDEKTGDLLFISSFYHGPMMIKVEETGASVVWQGKSNNPIKPDGPHCVMGSPVFHDGHGYAVGNQGELRCFKEESGEQLWLTYEAVAKRKADCGTAFIVPLAAESQPHRHVLFNDQGDLIFADLSPAGYKELDRAHLVDPVGFARGRDVVWSHPAFAGRSVFARNDKELVCVSLAEEG
jgi:outer membrane protein assembly factor BamB